MSNDPSDRAAVLDFLRELGASDAQLAEAAAADEPGRVALDVVLSREFVLSARDVATAANLPLDTTLAIAAQMGIVGIDPDVPMFSEDDVDLLALTNEIGSGLSHVLVSAIGRIADAGVASYVSEIDPRLVGTPGRDGAASGAGLRVMFENFRIRFGYSPGGVDDLELARASATAGEVALRAAGTLGSAFIHALRGAVRWHRIAQQRASDRSLHRIAVGFVDLSGFTSMSGEMSVEALTDLVLHFETTAFDRATAAGGRVVKHIGDEVMFVALDADAGATIAAGIVESLGIDDIMPRGGVAFGEVLAVHGDYYGSVVNLASRLTDNAVPGEVLVDEATASAVDLAGGLVEPAGRRMLKGFDDPVMVFSYVAGDRTVADATRHHPGPGR